MQIFHLADKFFAVDRDIAVTEARCAREFDRGVSWPMTSGGAPTAIFFASAATSRASCRSAPSGCYLYDASGARMLDFTSGQMSAILGH